MGGCSLKKDSLCSGVLEIFRRIQSIGYCLDHDAPSSSIVGKDDHEKVRKMFDEILSFFFKEIFDTEKYRPLPAVIGTEGPVDLYKLYSVVRERGGFSCMASAKSWGLVAKEVGLGSAFGSSLKLVYAKYLGTFDRWFERILDKKGAENLEEGRDGSDTLKVGSVDLEKDCSDQKSNECEVTPLSSKRHQLWTPVKGSRTKRQLNYEVDDDGVIILDPIVENESSLKREWESVVGLLNWVKRAATNPCDLSMGNVSLEGFSKGQATEGFSQAILARQAIFASFQRSSTDDALLQKKQKVHPSNYEDCIGQHDLTSNKLTRGPKIISLNKQSYAGSGSEISVVPDGDLDNGLARFDKTRLRKPTLSPGISKDHPHKRVPLGPYFQAIVPDWSDVSSAVSRSYSDDSRWLGKRIWPPEKEEKKLLTEQDPIGKGRQVTCGCKHQGSVECVRFHVAERRFLLKQKLGSGFFVWRFHHMGEEVALSWTKEEELKVKAVVHQNVPSEGRNFWHQIILSFPYMTRKKMVSYYFNVYLLRRRSYQNRVTPNYIDSDEEESEFDFASKSLGDDTVKPRKSQSAACVQNEQCMDLDE